MVFYALVSKVLSDFSQEMFKYEFYDMFEDDLHDINLANTFKQRL